MQNINRLRQIMAQLRDKENGCPWDIEQDFKSIAPHTIEEAYEVVDAIEKNDMAAFKEELGDLLLQVIFHCQIAEESNFFNFDDVVDILNKKLVDRHPHIFGDATIKTAAEQEASWENIKQQERDKKAKDGHASLLDGIALNLPALTRAVKIQKRAAKVGFDWPTIDYVFAKIEEEIGEIKEAMESGDQAHIEEEYGDLLFIMSNLGRWLKVDPEVALRKCIQKFEHRFHYIEQRVDVEKASLEEMDRLWEEAKKLV